MKFHGRHLMTAAALIALRSFAAAPDIRRDDWRIADLRAARPVVAADRRRPDGAVRQRNVVRGAR